MSNAIKTHAAPFVDFQLGWGRTQDERPWAQGFLDRLLGVEITVSDFGMKQIVVRLDNHDLAFFRVGSTLAHIIDWGRRWTVRIGYGNEDMSGPFRFQVTAVRGLRELEVTGLDEAYRFDTPKKKRTFQGPIRRSEVVQQIAREHGFVDSVTRSTAQFAGITQSNLSDGEFLTQLANKLGFIWYIADDFRLDLRQTLIFEPRAFHQRARDTFVVGQDQRILSDPSFDIDLTRVPETAIGAVHNPYQKAIDDFKATNGKTVRQVLGKSTPNVPGVGGNPEDEEGAGKASLQPGAIDAADLAELTDGFYKIREQNLVKVSITLQGQTHFHVDRVIALAGLGQGLDGNYYVREVKHRIDGTVGWEMEVSLLRNAFSHFTNRDFQEKVLALSGGQVADRPTNAQTETLGTGPDAETVRRNRAFEAAQAAQRAIDLGLPTIGPGP